MPNVMDYLLWRGDLTLEQSEFNEVDNLILAQLAYVEFDGIVPGEGVPKELPLKDASERYFSIYEEEEIKKRISMTKSAAFLMRSMALTKRFGQIRLSRYVNDISLKEESQFSALTITMEDESCFVAYRGTDNTIVGWKENFNMSFLSQTPGQMKAIEYLDRLALEGRKKIRIGGHSKGGNLSIYAAVHCKEEIRERILAVYSNDGPGFTKEVLEREAYLKLLPKIHTILPESSIVGLILEHEEAYEVVRSSQSGLMQHDAMSWEVLGPVFVRVHQVAQQSLLLEQTMKSWITRMDRTQREEFVDTLFGILEKAKIETVDDLANMKWKTFSEMMKVKNSLTKENQELLSNTVKMLWEESKRTMKQIIWEKPENSLGKSSKNFIKSGKKYKIEKNGVIKSK